MKNLTHFAVFGDIHGRIALMYTLAHLWEKNTHLKLAGLLQVGDMGAYPDITQLDDATLRYAKNDPDDLGFANFCYRTEESVKYFDNTDTPNTFFIRGNHEDFDYLASFSQPSPVDPWHKIWFIPDTHQIEVAKIQIGAFGGIPSKPEQRKRGKKNRQAYRRNQKHANTDPQFFNPKDILTAFRRLKKINILMTHAGPDCAELQDGSTQLTQLSERLKPQVHLFGHHHRIVGPCEGPGKSLLVGLEHLKFKENGQLQDGSWGILEMSNEAVNFEFISKNNAPWIAKITKNDYRYLWGLTPKALLWTPKNLKILGD